MKKKSLKLLRLNKKSISVLQFTGHIVGGTANADCTHGTCPSKIVRRCPIIGDASNNGCTGTPDETMTCPGYSCNCPIDDNIADA